MKFTSLTILAIAAHAAQVSAAAASQDSISCIRDHDAQTMASNFAKFAASWSHDPEGNAKLLNATYAVDLHDWSDSVRTIESHGCTNGPQPLDSSRDEFAKDQLSIPPFEFDVLKVWHSCDTVTFLWQQPVPSGQRVRGVVVLETERRFDGGHLKRLVTAVYSEFNTAAWLVDRGSFQPAKCEGAAPVLHE